MNVKMADEVELFLGSLDKKIDYGLLDRHSNMYLLGLLAVINKAADDRLISYEDCDILKQSVTHKVSEFKRELKKYEN